MLFPTIGFAVFFAIVFPVTWLLNAHNTWKKVFLVAASYYFYAAWRHVESGCGQRAAKAERRRSHDGCAGVAAGTAARRPPPGHGNPRSQCAVGPAGVDPESELA
jgi:hypothetical protein